MKKLSEFNKYLEFELKRIKEMETKIFSQIKGKQNKKSDIDLDELEEDLSRSRDRIKCLFERTIADGSNCLDVALWQKYIYYLVIFLAAKFTFKEFFIKKISL